MINVAFIPWPIKYQVYGGIHFIFMDRRQDCWDDCVYVCGTELPAEINCAVLEEMHTWTHSLLTLQEIYPNNNHDNNLPNPNLDLSLNLSLTFTQVFDLKLMIYIMGIFILSPLGRQVPTMRLCKQNYVPTTWAKHVVTHTQLTSGGKMGLHTAWKHIWQQETVDNHRPGSKTLENYAK